MKRGTAGTIPLIRDSPFLTVAQLFRQNSRSNPAKKLEDGYFFLPLLPRIKPMIWITNDSVPKITATTIEIIAIMSLADMKANLLSDRFCISTTYFQLNLQPP